MLPAGLEELLQALGLLGGQGDLLLGSSQGVKRTARACSGREAGPRDKAGGFFQHLLADEVQDLRGVLGVSEEVSGLARKTGS